MKKKIIAFLLVLSLSGPLFAGTVVDDFKVEGNQRLEKNTILSYLPFEKGDEISDSDLNKALKALYKTGFFDDVQVDLQDQTVYIKLKERPIISSISFEGNKKISTDVLKGEVQIKVRDIYNPAKVQQDVERMKMIYQRMGLLNAVIEADVKNKTRNRRDITFKIKEGSKKYIENIRHVNLLYSFLKICTLFHFH